MKRRAQWTSRTLPWCLFAGSPEAKRSTGGRRPARSALQMGDTLYMHPATMQALRDLLKRRQDKRDLMALQMGELGALLAEIGYGALKPGDQQSNGWRKP